MTNKSITIIVIFTILLLSIVCYYMTLETGIIIENIEKENIDKIVLNDFKVAILSNYGFNLIESRIINVIINKGQYYFYTNKKTYHFQQLTKDNRVSLLIYTKDGNIYKQILLYGTVEIIQTSKNLVLYKLTINHRKISVCKENKEDRVVNYNFDQTDPKELITNFNELSELMSDLDLISSDY